MEEGYFLYFQQAEDFAKEMAITVSMVVASLSIK